jgi:hypothetical protein
MTGLKSTYLGTLSTDILWSIMLMLNQHNRLSIIEMMKGASPYLSYNDHFKKYLHYTLLAIEMMTDAFPSLSYRIRNQLYYRAEINEMLGRDNYVYNSMLLCVYLKLSLQEGIEFFKMSFNSDCEADDIVLSIDEIYHDYSFNRDIESTVLGLLITCSTKNDGQNWYNKNLQNLTQ